MIERLGASLKAFSMAWAHTGRLWWSMGARTKIDYRGEVGDGRTNSIVMACIDWVCRTFPEAPVRISIINAQGELDAQPDHPLAELLERPNEFYSGETLWSATLTDWILTGNAYWLKIRSGMGRVVELWWVPSSMMEPRWPTDGSRFLTHYDYSPEGQAIRIETRDVVHFRYGIDPFNLRKGASPLLSLVRELYTDNEAAQYTATSLRNVGVPPLIIRPREDVKISQEDAEQVKDRFSSLTTGDNRGTAIVMRGATDVTMLGFNPQQMDVRSLRRVPEERVSAVLGIPAAVVGLGTGLENTKVGATMAEMREQAYESNIIPTQRRFGSELNNQLIPDFGDRRRLRLDFDLSQVRVLQEDQNNLFTRLNATAWMTIDEKRAATGQPPLEGEAGKALLIPTNVKPTLPADLLIEEAPEPAEPSPSLPAGQPAKVLALPALKGRKDNAVDATERVRNRIEEISTPEVAIFFRHQQRRVLGNLLRGRKADGIPGAEDLLPLIEEASLLSVLGIVHLRGLLATQELVESLLGVDIEFGTTRTRTFLTEVAGSVKGITDTTREAIRDAIVQSDDLAQLTERLQGLPEFTEARARMVARTEVASVVNRATLLAYQVSGVVVGVRVSDGDQDSGCAAVNGKTFPLEDAPPLLEHPNCVRQFSPITDARELAA